MNRRHASAMLAALALAPLAVRAQVPAKPHRIGFLGTSSPTDYAPNLKAFRDALRELGHDEGRNIVIEYRWAEGREERLPALASELVLRKPDVLVTHATGVRAAQQATSTIPIVMGVSADPVAAGYVASFAKPGGNTTGVASRMGELSAKRLEILKEAVPNLRDVALLAPAGSPGARSSIEETEAAANKLGVRVRTFLVDVDPSSLESAFASIVLARPQGLIVQPYPFAAKYAARIAELAVKNGLPTMGGGRYFAVDGGLMSYGGDFQDGWRVAARYVDRILKGAKPADLPIEQPATFEFVINLRTAKALGFTVPPALLARRPELIQ